MKNIFLIAWLSLFTFSAMANPCADYLSKLTKGAAEVVSAKSQKKQTLFVAFGTPKGEINTRFYDLVKEPRTLAADLNMTVIDEADLRGGAAVFKIKGTPKQFKELLEDHNALRAAKGHLPTATLEKLTGGRRS